MHMSLGEPWELVMDRDAWRAEIHGVTKSQTRLSNWTEFTLILEPIILSSYAILFFTALDFTSITSPIHNWVLFLLWLHLFIISGVISPLISSSILGTYRPGEFIFQCPIFLPFILFMGFSRREYWSGLPFPSLVDHVLSELSTKTCLPWVALHSMAHSFIELDKALCGPCDHIG